MDEYGKVINRLRVIDSLVEEKGGEKETFAVDIDVTVRAFNGTKSDRSSRRPSHGASV